MSILPDEATFAEFKKQCLSTDNWANKYDKYGMKVWVESPPADKGNNVARVHKIKVRSRQTDRNTRRAPSRWRLFSTPARVGFFVFNFAFVSLSVQ